MRSTGRTNRLPRLAIAAMNPAATMVWLGRRLVMDFGFGAILERFEKAFGSRTVNFILGLIGLAVALTCGKIIWDIALGPAVSFVAGLTANTSFWQIFLQVFWLAVAWVAGVAFTLLLIGSFLAWKRSRDLAVMVRHAKQLKDQAQGALNEAETAIDVIEGLTEKPNSLVTRAEKAKLDRQP